MTPEQPAKRYCTRCDDTGRTHSHEWYGPWPDGERRAVYRPCPDLTKEWHR